jgi:hypothetical protein
MPGPLGGEDLVERLTLLVASVGLAVVLGANVGARSANEENDTDPSSTASSGYRINKAISVSSVAGVAATRLELLEDERLTPKIRETWQGVGAAMSCAEPADDPDVARLCASFAEHPLRGALLRLVSESQGVLDQRLFEREVADLTPARLYDAGPAVFAVTVDYSVGFGSYAGPTTSFVEPSRGQLRWLAAYDSSTGKPAEVRLPRTLKSDWQTVPRPGGLDILAVRCQPNVGNESPTHLGGGGLSFVVIYERYHFDGSRWLRQQRQEAGFWESDHEFPANEKFPN